ncbi:MAG: MFS transporter [Planctomycetaceae bacterium]
MSPFMIVRLWIMVFLHYFVWGSWYATLSTYMDGALKFPGEQIGLAYGTTAIGAMVSPFFAGIVADRFFATQKLLGCLHLIGAGLLFLVSRETSFSAFYPLLILYTISYMAGHGLTNTLTLHHAVNPGKEFPIVMMAGSVGWIAAGQVLSFFNLENNAGIFQLASLSALLMGLYSFTLPHTPPKGAGEKISLRTMLGLDALKLLRDPVFATFMLCSFLICIPLSFYFSWVGAFLQELKIDNIAAKLTLGQVSDVIFLLLLPILLPKLGVKGILLLGMSAWALRFGLFAWFNSARDADWIMYLGIAVHGMCYDFIFVMGRMYVDKRTSVEIRGAAQGLHAFVTLGIGMFIGTWLSGIVAEHYKIEGPGDVITHNWQMIWAIPAVLSVILTGLFVVLFKDREASA